MTYATLQQLTDRYGAGMLVMLTDHAAVATGEIDETVVARALADTDALIDLHLKGRYALPLAEVPPMLADIAQAIAIWKLHRHEPDRKIEADYRDAMKLLVEIRDGRLRLSIEGVAPPGTGGTGARITDRDRPLTAENLKGFI